jgi:DNA-binding GntR family transcriptional regulator
MPEADSRAATALGARLPSPPGLSETYNTAPRSTAEPAEDGSPYRRIAAALVGAIECGAIAEGDPIPALKTLAKKYDVAFGTAQRAVALLAAEGHVTVRSGRRTIVSSRPERDPSQ